MKKIDIKQMLMIIAVIMMGVVLAVMILRSNKSHHAEDNHADHAMPSAVAAKPQDNEQSNKQQKEHEADHAPQAREIVKGPHGGKLFTQDGYGVEVIIYEKNVPPHFRIYTYQNNKALDPALSTITIELERLGISRQAFSFVKENDYLKGSAVVEEPHSFKASIAAKHNNKNYAFSYEQIEARVSISDKQILLNGIEVLTAGPTKIKSTLRLQGEIKLNADKSVQVVPRVGGMVESVLANAGDKVRKGQVLATISSQAIAATRSDLSAAQKKLNLARATFAREKQLWEEKISAEQDYLQARHDMQEAEINLSRVEQKLGALGAGTSGAGQARYEIRSPIAGVVTNKQISQGQTVSETNSLFEVADLSSVWVEMIIYAKDINTVKAGQKVTVKATAFDAETVGTISYVSAMVGEQSRTAMARVVLANPARTWLPGLPVNIELIAEEIEVPLAVSVEGIQTVRDSTVVFGRYGDYFEARPLQLGRRDDRHVEVLQGIPAGTKYAAGNSFLIKADIGKAGASHDH